MSTIIKTPCYLEPQVQSLSSIFDFNKVHKVIILNNYDYVCDDKETFPEHKEIPHHKWQGVFTNNNPFPVIRLFH